MDAAPISLTQAALLALIQGVTEFLPVSSSAHLILPAALTDWPDQGLAFDVAVHLGTLAAVLWHFRRELGAFAASGWALLTRGEWNANLHLAAQVGCATLPLAVVGWAGRDFVEAHLRTTETIALATILFGLALWWADRRDGQALAPSYPVAMAIGLAQAFAIIPGASRAGVTIAAALALGLGRGAATRFSFLLAAPAIGGAALLMATEVDAIDRAHWPPLALGFGGAALCGACCIAAFTRFVEHIGMRPFVIYRLVLGILLLVFF